MFVMDCEILMIETRTSGVVPPVAHLFGDPLDIAAAKTLPSTACSRWALAAAPVENIGNTVAEDRPVSPCVSQVRENA